MDKPTHLLWQKKRKDYKDLHKVDNCYSRIHLEYNEINFIPLVENTVFWC